MHSEYYFTESKGKQSLSNETPFTVPSYSGREVRIAAYGRGVLPQELPVKMLLRDMFGKTYELNVIAKAGLDWRRPNSSVSAST